MEEISMSCDLSGKLILVTDDDEFNRNMIKLILQKQHAEVVLCDNGLQAFTECEKRNFDLILLDNRMPIMSGVEAAERIKQISPNVKIIMISGDIYDCLESAKSNDFDDCLPKPFNKTQLNIILSKHLKIKLNKTEYKIKNPLVQDTLEYNFDSIYKVTHGKKMQFMELIDLFLHLNSDTIQIIKAAYENHQWQKIADQAHKFISPLRQIEAIQMVTLLSKIEMTIEMKKERAAADISNLEKYSIVLNNALNKLKSSL